MKRKFAILLSAMLLTQAVCGLSLIHIYLVVQVYGSLLVPDNK